MSFRPDSVRGFAMRGGCVLALACAVSATTPQHAMAQAAAPQVTPPPSGPVIPQAPTTMTGPTGSAVVNLIRLLVEQGILTQDKANALIRPLSEYVGPDERHVPDRPQ